MVMTALTVYRTNQPENSRHRNKPEDFSDVEYYQIALSEQENEAGIQKPTVLVFHGWWDELTKEPKSNHLILKAAYETWEAADVAFEKQLSNYATQGYIHAFTPAPPWGSHYRKLA
jgi:hypothetical protein